MLKGGRSQARRPLGAEKFSFLFENASTFIYSRSHGVMHEFKSWWDIIKNNFIFRNAEVKTIKNISKNRKEGNAYNVI